MNETTGGCGVEVEVTVVGEQTYTFTVTDETYADLVKQVDLSPQEVSVLVEGKPVPEDQVVDASEITILRLIKGG